MKRLLLLVFLFASIFTFQSFAQTVYATKTGAKYHTKTCRYSINGHAMQLQDAKTTGLTPCSVCHPPDYEGTIDKLPVNQLEVQKLPGQNQTMIYITKTGSKYHKSACRYATNGWEVSIETAKSKGLTPCSVCHPPNQKP